MSATIFARTELLCAAMAFVDGLCIALVPTGGPREPRPVPRGTKADDAVQFCIDEDARLDRDAKLNFFAECRAKFDASLARIAASDDITRYSIAAE